LDASETKFNVFLGMALDNFESDNPHYVRLIEGKKEYIEKKLTEFLRHALRSEAIKQFGPLPTGTV
jgi:hypothetical protein